MKLKDLLEQRGKVIADARGILDKAREENRTMTEEEAANWDQLMGKADEMRATIDAETRQAEADREAAAAVAEMEREAPKPSEMSKEEARALAFRKAIIGGKDALTGEELRALQFTDDSAGGYLSPPEEFVNRLIQAIDDQTVIRQRATVQTVTSAHSLGVPSLEADPADADWTTELGTGSADSTMSFGKREFMPHPLAKRIKVSNKLLRASAMPAESIVADRLAYKFGITMEKAYLTGSGASQPLGLFTASDSGIGTARDVSTDNTTTAITFDGLMNAKYSLKSGYLAGAEWLFHRDAVKQLAKLKNGSGDYIWQPSAVAGTPDRLLGHPVIMSEYVPNTFTAGLYVGMFGDFSYYWIADALGFSVQRLTELYAETNETGFIGRMESDGMPVLAEAFARVTLAAA